MRPVIVLVTSQKKKDALIKAKAVSDISNIELKPINFNDGLEHSCAKNIIDRQQECYIECCAIDNSDASRNKLLEILTDLKKAVLKSCPRGISFTSLAFAAAMFYPAGSSTAFLDVIACPHASGKHLGYGSADELQSAIYEAISHKDAQLSYPELAKTLALLLSK